MQLAWVAAAGEFARQLALRLRPAAPPAASRSAKTNSAERLFDFPDIGPLPPPAARTAIAKPAKAEGVKVSEDGLGHIVRKTGGYPYFLQEWGKHAWDTASKSPITLADVELASASAVAALDESFFRVRLPSCVCLKSVFCSESKSVAMEKRFEKCNPKSVTRCVT